MKINPCLYVLALSTAILAGLLDATAAAAEDAIKIHNPKTLPAQISCERIPLGVPGDYKPSIAALPSGELLLTMFHQHELKENVGKRKRTIVELALLYRSKDGGKTWIGPETLSLMGREPSLTVLNDGTIFITTHLHTADVRNDQGYIISYVHRSQDGGRSWSTTRCESEEFPPRTMCLTTRNVLKLADGSLLMGISDHQVVNGKSFVWRSLDDGRSWPEKYPAHFEEVPENYPYTLFGEAHLWQARSGKIYAIVRVGTGNSWPMSGTTDPGLENRDRADNYERMIVYASTDQGRNWQKVRDLSDYGQMYPSILRLADGRLLLTFTQREFSPPLGLRATVGRETEDGFTFDLEQDQIMIETKTPLGKHSGGGFGPTVQLKDGTLVSSYTYRGEDGKEHAEVVRWKLPRQK